MYKNAPWEHIHMHGALVAKTEIFWTTHSTHLNLFKTTNLHQCLHKEYDEMIRLLPAPYKF